MQQRLSPVAAVLGLRLQQQPVAPGAVGCAVVQVGPHVERHALAHRLSEAQRHGRPAVGRGTGRRRAAGSSRVKVCGMLRVAYCVWYRGQLASTYTDMPALFSTVTHWQPQLRCTTKLHACCLVSVCIGCTHHVPGCAGLPAYTYQQVARMRSDLSLQWLCLSCAWSTPGPLTCTRLRQLASTCTYLPARQHHHPG